MEREGREGVWSENGPPGLTRMVGPNRTDRVQASSAHMAVKARFWLWLSGKGPSNSVSCPPFPRKLSQTEKVLPFSCTKYPCTPQPLSMRPALTPPCPTPKTPPGVRAMSSDECIQETSARYRIVEPSNGSNVIPRWARPGLAGLGPHTGSWRAVAGGSFLTISNVIVSAAASPERTHSSLLDDGNGSGSAGSGTAAGGSFLTISK